MHLNWLHILNKSDAILPVLVMAIRKTQISINFHVMLVTLV